MKNVYFLFLLVLSVGVNAQWVQTNGPYGGSLRTLVVDSPFVYTGGDYAGVYKSSDNGLTWTRINSGLTSLRVMSLVKVSGNLIAGTDVGGFFLSTDDGVSWSSVNNGFSQPNNTVALSLVAVSDTIFAATNLGVYMTTDFGASWIPRNNGISSLGVASIVVNGPDMFAGNSKVYYSNSRGQNWVEVSAGLGGNGASAFVVKDTSLFAASMDTVFISNNKGSTWSPIPAFNMNGSGQIVSFLIDSGKIFAGTYWGGLYVSYDNCNSWQQLTNGIFHGEVKAISKIGANLIIATAGGIYQSSNNGSSWFRTDTNLAATTVEDLFIDGQNIFAASSRNGVSISSDGGATWNYSDTIMEGKGALSVVVKGNSVFAGGYQGVWYSSNYGMNWAPKNNGLGLNSCKSLVINSNGVLACIGGLQYSANNGNNWSQITSGIFDHTIQDIAISGDTVFIGTSNTRISRSTDGGMNWTLVYDGCCFPSNPIWALTISGNKVAAATSKGVIVSHDYGNTWAFTNNGLLWQQCISIASLGSNLWVGSKGGVYFSNDFGATWNPDYVGMDTAKWVNSFALDSSYIYAGTVSAGMWKRRLSDFPSAITKTSISSSILLYPNPFADEINLQVDESLTNATLIIYNLYGQQVKQIDNLTGKTFVIHRDNLSNGLYFLRLTQRTQVIGTHKLVISSDR